MSVPLVYVALCALSACGCIILSSVVIAVIRTHFLLVEQSIPAVGVGMPIDTVATATLYGVPIALIVMGLVYICRKSGLPTKYAPEVSVLFGILGGEAYEWQAPTSNHNLLEGAVYGIVIGFIASGIWSQAQTKFQSLLNGSNAPSQPPVPSTPSAPPQP